MHHGSRHSHFFKKSKLVYCVMHIENVNFSSGKISSIMYCAVGQSAIKMQRFVHVFLKLIAVCERGMYESLWQESKLMFEFHVAVCN